LYGFPNEQDEKAFTFTGILD